MMIKAIAITGSLLSVVQGGALRTSSEQKIACTFTKYWANVKAECDTGKLEGKLCEFAKNCEGAESTATTLTSDSTSESTTGNTDNTEGCELVCAKNKCAATGTNPIGKKAVAEGREWKDEPTWTVKKEMAEETGCCFLAGGACDLCCPPKETTTTTTGGGMVSTDEDAPEDDTTLPVKENVKECVDKCDCSHIEYPALNVNDGLCQTCLKSKKKSFNNDRKQYCADTPQADDSTST